MYWVLKSKNLASAESYILKSIKAGCGFIYIIILYSLSSIAVIFLYKQVFSRIQRLYNSHVCFFQTWYFLET